MAREPKSGPQNNGVKPRRKAAQTVQKTVTTVEAIHNQLLPIEEVAALLRTSPAQARNMVGRGQLVKPLKVPGLGLRWRAVELLEWVKNIWGNPNGSSPMRLLLAALLVISCDPQPDGTRSSSATGDSSESSGSSSSSSESATSDSSGGSTDGGSTDAGSSGISTGDLLPSCFGEPCDDECGSGLVCRPRPQTGERVCVALCPTQICEVASVSCGEAPVTTCILGACFPV